MGVWRAPKMKRIRPADYGWAFGSAVSIPHDPRAIRFADVRERNG